MFYEYRRYQLRPGCRDAWVRYMEEVIIPFQISKGMVVTASFVDAENENGYVWMRRFENERHREHAYTAVYESDEWKNEFVPVIDTMLIREQISVTRLVPTPRSAVR